MSDARLPLRPPPAPASPVFYARLLHPPPAPASPTSYSHLLRLLRLPSTPSTPGPPPTPASHARLPLPPPTPASHVTLLHVAPSRFETTYIRGSKGPGSNEWRRGRRRLSGPCWLQLGLLVTARVSQRTQASTVRIPGWPGLNPGRPTRQSGLRLNQPGFGQDQPWIGSLDPGPTRADPGGGTPALRIRADPGDLGRSCPIWVSPDRGLVFLMSLSLRPGGSWVTPVPPST